MGSSRSQWSRRATDADRHRGCSSSCGVGSESGGDDAGEPAVSDRRCSSDDSEQLECPTAGAAMAGAVIARERQSSEPSSGGPGLD
eukprot:6057787-Pyramimonas_sp.AAC.1